jgi:L-iditol 2-dehydrogenase
MMKMKRVLMTGINRLAVQEVEKAQAQPGEALVKVMRCGVCGSDSTILRGKQPWAIRPLVLGHEFSGVVEEHGTGVCVPPIGTRVAVIPHRVCSRCWACRSQRHNLCEHLRCMGAEADGGHAQYVSVPAEMLVPIPAGMSFEQAAMLEPACVGLHAVRRVDVTGKSVLVLGSGPIGVFTAQCARALGAGKVYVADPDSWRLTIARKPGATTTLDLSKANLETAAAARRIDLKQVSVFFDCVGLEGQALDEILRIARRGSSVVVVGVLQIRYKLPHLPDMVQHELSLHGTTMYVADDFRQMIQLLAEKRVSTDGLVTHEFSLDRIPEVFRLIEARTEPVFKIMLRING